MLCVTVVLSLWFQPSNLSEKSLSVTGKELKRDRQVLADRMKKYLAQDDDDVGEKLGENVEWMG